MKIHEAKVGDVSTGQIPIMCNIERAVLAYIFMRHRMGLSKICPAFCILVRERLGSAQ